jgi:DNA-binding MurR/RpiR family transcriptional regulator
MTITEIQLPKVAQTRINRLAHASGRSPAAMLRFVLREGFDAVELSIKENAQADEQFAAGAAMSHVDVMRDALSAIHQAKLRAQAAA